MAELDKIFKAYDIRGTVPDQLDVDTVRAIGNAFARFSGAPRILVGRDMRLSGVELSAAFAEGVIGYGADVVDLGLASTDLVYFASGRLDAPAAMLTASHNPAQYNGIKLCLAGAKPVGQDTGLSAIKAFVTDGLAPVDGRHWGAIGQLDMLDEFADHVRSFVDVPAMSALRVVADTANGMGGLVAPRVLSGLPVEFEILFGELDGSFPNHPPDPIQPENLKALQARVLETGADVGLAFDGDADRV
ncbi:MAG: phosphomannomutase/phosphoglucomutase, partial [Pseudonocardiaceae bacterium]